MTRTRLIVLMATLLAFAAGGALGLLLYRPAPPGHPGNPLTRDLKLTPEQQAKMDKIWSDTMRSLTSQYGDRRRQLAQQRDQAILALLSSEQKAQYDQIMQDYARGQEELSQERAKAFQDAMAQTKLILSPEQAQKFEELMKRRGEHGRGFGRRDRDGRGPESRPASHSAPGVQE